MFCRQRERVDEQRESWGMAISGLALGWTPPHTRRPWRWAVGPSRFWAPASTGPTQAENRGLQDRIAHDGLVQSQFWPDAPPGRRTFPMRNATMSGYGRATVVVGGGETSGARIQVRVDIEHGRPIILTDRVLRAND